ncbi:carbohydrate sulfotransferase 9-like isoform X2 [Littorina saxatilis]|uniref:Carbohydrate sulfotransferase n=1 Tax=Littorina saxatilis TaxID=31220 RepID=A0AAN9BPZ5_9CAEN
MTIVARVRRLRVWLLAVVLVILQTCFILQQAVNIHSMEAALKNNNTEVKKIERLKLVSDTCRLHSREIAGAVEQVYVYKAKRVAYCSTHKIASTFWIRVYRWLYNDTRTGHVRSPLDISKLDTHLLKLKKLKVRDVTKNALDRALVKRSYRFLFTREPFARLWSVFIDKFLLPDNYFWSAYSPAIKKSVYGPEKVKNPGSRSRQKAPAGIIDIKRPLVKPPAAAAVFRAAVQNVNNQNVAAPPPVSTARPAAFTYVREQNLPAPIRKPVRCFNVTFSEFLQYIVNVANQRSGKALDDHFRPVHYGCNPCLFNPDFIGKIESMRTDSEEVLRRMGLEFLLPELSNSSHVEQEMNMLTDFNFEIVIKKKLQKSCVTHAGLESRLIRAFVYNGYLTEEDERFLQSRIPLGLKRFKQVVLDLYKKSGRTSADVKRQRTRYKQEAYKGLPKPLLDSLQKVFHWDFVLFGYEPFPSEIFGR